MAIRCQPASFSRSLRTVIWKQTDTRQCRMLLGVRVLSREGHPHPQPATPGNQETPTLPSPAQPIWCHLPSM